MDKIKNSEKKYKIVKEKKKKRNCCIETKLQHSFCEYSQPQK